MIRAVKHSDLSACADLIRKSFQTVADEFGFTAENAPRFTAFATTEERLVRQMDGEHRLMYLDEEEDRICGYYSLLLRDQGECELSNLSVLPGYRHRGIGGKLLQHAVKTAREKGCTAMNLSIVEENAVLRSWYERNGAVHVGTEKFDFFPFTCGYMKIRLQEKEPVNCRIIEGANRFETYTKTRAGSRAVIVRDGMILLIHETNSGWWLVPGGGMEEGETPEECCIREAEEETGCIVRPVRQFLTLYEYYEEYRYISYYFICEVTGSGRMHPTDAEIRRGAGPQWLPLREAVDIFSRHQSYAKVSEEQRGAYLREYTALQEYLAMGK